MPETVLVTGGAGYIGSTICSALEDAGHYPIVLDSLGKRRGPVVIGSRPFYRGDVSDPKVIAEDLLDDHPDIGCCIHCAALASRPRLSRPSPGLLLKQCLRHCRSHQESHLTMAVRRIVFSSSASVYDTSFGPEVDESRRPPGPFESIREDQADNGDGPRGPVSAGI